MRVLVDVDGNLETETRRCELDVLGRWYGDTEESLREAYGAYEASTVFISVLHADKGVVGFARIITPSALVPKTISDLSAPPWSVDGLRSAELAGLDLQTTWDFATLGVRPELGGGGRVVAAAIYHTVIAAAHANGISSVVAITDRRVRSLLAAAGLMIHALPGTRSEPYMGSPACIPVYAHLAELVDRQRREAPDAYRLISLGVGLDGIALPRGDSLLLHRHWRRSA